MHEAQRHSLDAIIDGKPVKIEFVLAAEYDRLLEQLNNQRNLKVHARRQRETMNLKLEEASIRIAELEDLLVIAAFKPHERT